MSSVASICCDGAEKEKHQLINTFSLQHPCSPGDFPFKGSTREGQGDADTRGTEQQEHSFTDRKNEKMKSQGISGKSRAKKGKGLPSPASLARADPRQGFQRLRRSFNCKRNEGFQPKKNHGEGWRGKSGCLLRAADAGEVVSVLICSFKSEPGV